MTDEKWEKIRPFAEAEARAYIDNDEITYDNDRLSSNKKELLRETNEMYKDYNAIYHISWRNHRTGAYGAGTETFSFSEAQKLCLQLNRDWPEIGHWPEPSTGKANPTAASSGRAAADTGPDQQQE